jgi:hypothetical protein
MSKHFYATTYEERVAQVVAAFVGHRDVMDFFRHVVLVLENPDDNMSLAGPVSDKVREAIIHDAWWGLLHQYDPKNNISEQVRQPILAGILKNDRWRSCGESERDAYAFAALVARFMSRSVAEYSKVPASEVASHLAVMETLQVHLNAWLSPGASVTYDAQSFAIAIFGSAWYELLVDHPAKIAKLIENTRPPFACGILQGHLDQVASPLPEFDR